MRMKSKSPIGRDIERGIIEQLKRRRLEELSN